MTVDFYYALIIGWGLMLAFWLVIVIFVHIRKPPKSKLTINLILKSLLLFFIAYLMILIFSDVDSFF